MLMLTSGEDNWGTDYFRSNKFIKRNSSYRKKKATEKQKYTKIQICKCHVKHYGSQSD